MAKIKFRTAYDEPQRIHCEPGNVMYPTYGYVIKANGKKTLEKTGELNRYEEIQSYLEETKIENVLKRVAVGDMSDFRAQGIYQDVSEIPKNLIEARMEIQRLENFWNKLPIETRLKYNNSIDEFIAEAGKESWLVDVGLKQPENPVQVELDPAPELSGETKE